MAKQVVLANLSPQEKERFYEFLVANEVDFVPKGDSYVATVQIVKPGAGSGAHDEQVRKPRKTALPSPGSVAEYPSSAKTSPRSVSGYAPSGKSSPAYSQFSFNSTGAPSSSKASSSRLSTPVSSKSSSSYPFFKKNGLSIPDPRSLGMHGPPPIPKGILQDSDVINLVLDKSNKPKHADECNPEHDGSHLRDVDNRSTSLRKIREKYSSFTQHLSSEPNVKAIRRTQVYKLFDDIYERRYAQQLSHEKACLAPGPQPKPLPTFSYFCVDYISKTYGLRKLRMEMCWGFLASIDMLRSDHVGVDVFGKFLDDTFDDVSDLVFYLNARQAVDAMANTMKDSKALKRREHAMDFRLEPRQCITFVRRVMADPSYADLRQEVLDSLDALMEQETDSVQPTLDADTLLDVTTSAYSVRRKEEAKLDELRNPASPGPTDSMFDPLPTEDEHLETILELDPDLQRHVHKAVDRIVLELGRFGEEAEASEVYDFTLKNALRANKRELHGASGKQTEGGQYVTLAEMRQGFDKVNKVHSPRKVKPVKEMGPTSVQLEKCRLLALSPDEFEDNLEVNVRKLLVAAIENVVTRPAQEHARSANEAELRDMLTEEFIPVADAMMEAVVNNDYEKWLVQICVVPPGTDEQQRKFEKMNNDFQVGLVNGIDTAAVYDICRSVVGTPEVAEIIGERACTLAMQLQRNENM